MGMQLNIKDEDTVLATRRLAAKLGKSVTATVREAIAEKEARTELRAMHVDVGALLAKARGLRDHWTPEYRNQDLSITHGDLLYDDTGAPR
jgi:hypothetical protein